MEKFVTFTLKPSDLITTLTYVLMDNFCIFFFLFDVFYIYLWDYNYLFIFIYPTIYIYG